MKSKLHKDIKKLIKENKNNSFVAFFCKNRKIAEAFTNYIYFDSLGINFFLDVDDCMCYDLIAETSFFVTDDEHMNYILINVYLED